MKYLMFSTGVWGRGIFVQRMHTEESRVFFPDLSCPSKRAYNVIPLIIEVGLSTHSACFQNC